MKILLTGFEPFGGEDINPSWEAVQRLHAPEGTELVKLRLPVVFREAGEQLAAALAREQPDLTLCIGQAAGRDAITPERLGVNLMDASIPDNAGFQPQEEPVIPGAPAAYFARLPVKELAQAIRDAGVPAQVSNSAGLFVCNALLCRLLYEIETHYPQMRGGFLHVPCLPEQAERLGKGAALPSLTLPEIVRGLQAALAFCSRLEPDVP
jgi:pyroglutamyl-peptidase